MKSLLTFVFELGVPAESTSLFSLIWGIIIFSLRARSQQQIALDINFCYFFICLFLQLYLKYFLRKMKKKKKNPKTSSGVAAPSFTF